MKHRGPWTRGHHGGPPWARGGEPVEWAQSWRGKRGKLFVRFAAVFGFMALLIMGGMAILAFLITQLFGGGGQTAVLVWIGGLGLVMALPTLAVTMAVRAFRSIATPLADLMAAADDVAAGNLSVRVREHGPGEFRRMAGSFNRMAGELERTDRQRRNMTADVAHELRTPLHVIQGNLEGILDDVYEPTKEHIGATLEETRLLGRLVEDLGTLSLAESGQLAFLKETVDLAELLIDLGTTFSVQAETAGIDLQVETGGDPVGLKVIADAARIDQVLGNLVVNALRHTHRGGSITLRAEPYAEGVRLSVSDTGEGIPSDDLPFVFDRFWRADRSRSHAGGEGAGLGLAIARQLVRGQRGNIGVESEPGLGTTFTIELPTGD